MSKIRTCDSRTFDVPENLDAHARSWTTAAYAAGYRAGKADMHEAWTRELHEKLPQILKQVCERTATDLTRKLRDYYLAEGTEKRVERDEGGNIVRTIEHPIRVWQELDAQ